MSIGRVKENGFWLALLAVALVALMGWLIAAGPARADSTAKLTVGSDTVAPGESTTVSVSVAGGGGKTVGAVTVDVTYDDTLVSVVECTPAAVCNPAFDDPNTPEVETNVVRIVRADPAGLAELGTITFLAGATEGTAALTIDDPVGDPVEGIVTCADETGVDLTCSANNGSITIVAPPPPTDTPVPPAATDTPVPGAATATPDGDGIVPPITGTSGSGGNSASTWLILALAGAGLAAIAGFGALRLRKA